MRNLYQISDNSYEMFFNFGPFDFGVGEVPPRRQPNRNRNQNQGGIFGGLN